MSATGHLPVIFSYDTVECNKESKCNPPYFSHYVYFAILRWVKVLVATGNYRENEAKKIVGTISVIIIISIDFSN